MEQLALSKKTPSVIQLSKLLLPSVFVNLILQLELVTWNSESPTAGAGKG